MQHLCEPASMRMWAVCFVLASLTLPLAFERHSLAQQSAQQAERGQGVKPAGAAKPERRVALVIGNGNYAVRPLDNPPNDARALAVALKDLGFEVISGENLKRAEMQQKLRAFEASLRGSTVGLFFFAGHGVQVNGVNYLIPIGADARVSQANKVIFSIHAVDEMDADDLLKVDVVNCILQGEIVTRQWDHDFQEWKYLVDGKTLDGFDLEVVAKLKRDNTVVITAYLL